MAKCASIGIRIDGFLFRFILTWPKVVNWKNKIDVVTHCKKYWLRRRRQQLPTFNSSLWLSLKKSWRHSLLCLHTCNDRWTFRNCKKEIMRPANFVGTIFFPFDTTPHTSTSVKTKRTIQIRLNVLRWWIQ